MTLRARRAGITRHWQLHDAGVWHDPLRPGLHLDYRILLSGYLPDYAYDMGATDTSIPFERLRALARIHDKAKEADGDPDYSRLIRVGIPVPH